MSALYKIAFGFGLLENEPRTTCLFQAIVARHDIVHRNGKSKDGEMVSIGMANVDTLIRDLLDLAEDVEAGLLAQPQ